MHVAVDRAHLDQLNDLFTRSYYSAAGYVFESQPFVVPADADLLDLLSGIRREDRRHAQLLAGVIDDLEAVPLAGAFPYWYRDLNYLSVPYLANFVVEALREDIARYEAAIASLPADALGAKATLTAIRRDKQTQVEKLVPQARAARTREAADHAEKVAARKAARAARLAKEKAAKEAARKKAAAPKAAAPAAGATLDPNEPGISPKEKARRTMLLKRGGAVAASTAAAPAAAAAAPGLDPNEPGITPKEKARRAMLAKRGAAAAPAATAPAAAPAPAAGLDPDEPGISPKEKARRQMLAKRAASAGSGPAAAAGGGAAPAAAAPAPAPAAPAPAAAAPPPAPPGPVEEDLDPDEEGISPKEKARRTMLRKRRGK